MKQGKCYIIRESIVPGSNGRPMDFTPAEKFGEVEFVTYSDFSYNPIGGINNELIDKMRKVADKYDPDVDYIILAGPPMSIFMMGAVISEEHARMNVLLWDRRIQDYRPVTVHLE